MAEALVTNGSRRSRSTTAFLVINGVPSTRSVSSKTRSALEFDLRYQAAGAVDTLRLLMRFTERLLQP